MCMVEIRRFFWGGGGGGEGEGGEEGEGVMVCVYRLEGGGLPQDYGFGETGFGMGFGGFLKGGC